VTPDAVGKSSRDSPGWRSNDTGVAAAIAVAVEQAGPQDDLAATARNAAAKAVEAFRGKANRIGRARMFSEKSAGMDDPGMVAVLRMTQSL